jgi:hypothetical protein
VLTSSDIERVRRDLDRLAPPVLSLYVPVNIGRPGNVPRALVTRIKKALGSLEIPAPIAERALAALDARPVARSVAVFADHARAVSVGFGLDLPIVDPRTGEIEARFGPPDLAALEVGFAAPRYGAVFIDRGRWRLFEIFAGEIEELDQSARRPAVGEEVDVDTSKQVFPNYLPSRGGAALDLADRHDREWSYRFYRASAVEVRRWAEQRRLERLLLFGPAPITAAFADVLASEVDLRAPVAAHVSSLPDPEAAPSRVLEHLTPAIEADRDRTIDELLNRIGVEGVSGLGPTLAALQRGRLALVVAPWHALPDGARVYRGLSAEVVAAPGDGDGDGDGELSGDMEELALRDAVVELAHSQRTEIVFLVGETASRLDREHGGLAGLRRW